MSVVVGDGAFDFGPLPHHHHHHHHPLDSTHEAAVAEGFSVDLDRVGCGAVDFDADGGDRTHPGIRSSTRPQERPEIDESSDGFVGDVDAKDSVIDATNSAVDRDSPSPIPSSMQLQNNLQFRFLNPDDIDELKSLCKECFPVEYPEEWYQDITKDDGRFFSLASTLKGKIVGFIVAEIKTRLRCNKEDQDILSTSYPYSTPVAYILSLGVSCQFRCRGVGSLLLDNLLSHLTSKDQDNCKAVFLHVLCTNVQAIRFYEKRHFSRHSFLPFYYTIQGKLKDGFSYVLYLNGGRPPWTLRGTLERAAVTLASLRPCRVSTRILCRANQWLWYLICAMVYGVKKTSMSAVAMGWQRT